MELDRSVSDRLKRSQKSWRVCHGPRRSDWKMGETVRLLTDEGLKYGVLWYAYKENVGKGDGMGWDGLVKPLYLSSGVFLAACQARAGGFRLRTCSNETKNILNIDADMHSHQLQWG